MLNESSCLAAALGVTKFMKINAMNLPSFKQVDEMTQYQKVHHNTQHNNTAVIMRCRVLYRDLTDKR
jgi:hypothetical protein